MRKFYEEKLSEMKSRVHALEVERTAIITDLRSTSASPSTVGDIPESEQAAQAALNARLKETERQLAELKSKQRDLERIAEIKSKMSAEVCMRWK